MRISTGSVVAAFLSAAILAACGGGNNGLSSSTPLSVTPQIGAPQSVEGSASQRFKPLSSRRNSSGSEQVLYSFKSGTDGANPRASLIDLNGTFYGTTSRGGGHRRCHRLGCGTVFALRTSGVETVLYRFRGVSGTSPLADLLNVKGTLYGTTAG